MQGSNIVFQVNRKLPENSANHFYYKYFKENFEFPVVAKKIEDKWTIDARYGYQFQAQDCNVEGEKYRLYRALPLREGDVWERNGKRFRVGKVTGFLNFTAPLISEETGENVAIIKFEEYYKD